MLYIEQPQTQQFVLTNRCFSLTGLLGWWWFHWAHLGQLTLDFTLVLNSDLSHVVIAPFGISCYLVYFLLMIMARHASDPAHKIKPMVLTRAFETLCILIFSFPPHCFLLCFLIQVK